MGGSAWRRLLEINQAPPRGQLRINNAAPHACRCVRCVCVCVCVSLRASLCPSTLAREMIAFDINQKRKWWSLRLKVAVCVTEFFFSRVGFFFLLSIFLNAQEPRRHQVARREEATRWAEEEEEEPTARADWSTPGHRLRWNNWPFCFADRPPTRRATNQRAPSLSPRPPNSVKCRNNQRNIPKKNKQTNLQYS